MASLSDIAEATDSDQEFESEQSEELAVPENIRMIEASAQRFNDIEDDFE